jgi:hypothetical protein
MVWAFGAGDMGGGWGEIRGNGLDLEEEKVFFASVFLVGRREEILGGYGGEG